jgi:hypothetical protein
LRVTEVEFFKQRETIRDEEQVLLIFSKLGQMREVKVVIFLEKARRPFAGILSWLERLSDVIFNGKRETWVRRLFRSL